MSIYLRSCSGSILEFRLSREAAEGDSFWEKCLEAQNIPTHQQYSVLDMGIYLTYLFYLSKSFRYSIKKQIMMDLVPKVALKCL